MTRKERVRRVHEAVKASDGPMITLHLEDAQTLLKLTQGAMARATRT